MSVERVHFELTKLKKTGEITTSLEFHCILNGTKNLFTKNSISKASRSVGSSIKLINKIN